MRLKAANKNAKYRPWGNKSGTSCRNVKTSSDETMFRNIMEVTMVVTREVAEDRSKEGQRPMIRWLPTGNSFARIADFPIKYFSTNFSLTPLGRQFMGAYHNTNISLVPPFSCQKSDLRSASAQATACASMIGASLQVPHYFFPTQDRRSRK